jgi:hypothetical protein
MKSHEYGVKFTVNNFIDIFIMVKALKRIFNECKFKKTFQCIFIRCLWANYREIITVKNGIPEKWKNNSSKI